MCSIYLYFKKNLKYKDKLQSYIELNLKSSQLLVFLPLRCLF
jgi:hypothetical protein